MNEPEFVTVRIAVAISPDGTWYAMGSNYDVPDQWKNMNFGPGVLTFVEAQIPLPKPQSINTIKGKVVE